MSVFEIILISIGLAMDAFGVSIGKGLTMPVGENGRKVTLAFLNRPLNVRPKILTLRRSVFLWQNIVLYLN